MSLSRRYAIFCCTWLLLAAASLRGSTTPLGAAPPAAHAYHGYYFWTEQGVGDDIDAIFTPTGEDTWTVDFHFTFQDHPQTFSGDAVGKLVSTDAARPTDDSAPSLQGTVYTSAHDRTYAFRGLIDASGQFSGSTYRIEDFEEEEIGTLVLNPGPRTSAGSEAQALSVPVEDEVTVPATPQSFEGSYTWIEITPSSSGDLDVHFEPTGEGTWKVEFHFAMGERKLVYAGTANGSLDSGPLAGEVLEDPGSRTFFFRGETKDGIFQGEHGRLESSGELVSGTLTLQPTATEPGG